MVTDLFVAIISKVVVLLKFPVLRVLQIEDFKVRLSGGCSLWCAYYGRLESASSSSCLSCGHIEKQSEYLKARVSEVKFDVFASDFHVTGYTPYHK